MDGLLAAFDDAYDSKYGMHAAGIPGDTGVFAVSPRTVFAWREKDFPGQRHAMAVSVTCETICYSGPPQITVELPDDIAQHADPGREALERLAVEGYRSGALTHHQAGQLLGLSRFEFDDFLIERKIHDHAYSIEDLQQDLADLEKLRAQGLLSK
jgi:predicted HTH domain antitoxin